MRERSGGGCLRLQIPATARDAGGTQRQGRETEGAGSSNRGLVTADLKAINGIERALAGEQVIIARNNVPTVRLEVLPGVRRKRRLGTLDGLVRHMSDDFDEPLDDFEDDR